jgi:hypothetical protein
MPSRKQRRRRAKELRHEYVWEDEEGNELDPEDAPTKKAASERGRSASGGRQPQAPSWERTLKRAAIFAPIMFVTVMLLSSKLTLVQQLTQTAIIVAIFVPFSHLLDRVLWRSHQKRLARREGSSGRAS